MPVLTYDELATKRATPSDVKRYREQIEALPVRCNDNVSIDADERSELRMRDTIERWDRLGLETIEWRLGDNTFKTMNQHQLRFYFEEMLDKRAARALTIYPEYLALRDHPETTLRDLENWLTQYKV